MTKHSTFLAILLAVDIPKQQHHLEMPPGRGPLRQRCIVCDHSGLTVHPEASAGIRTILVQQVDLAGPLRCLSITVHLHMCMGVEKFFRGKASMESKFGKGKFRGWIKKQEKTSKSLQHRVVRDRKEHARFFWIDRAGRDSGPNNWIRNRYEPEAETHCNTGVRWSSWWRGWQGPSGRIVSASQRNRLANRVDSLGTD